uniref:Tubulin--tyrosine ligase-like protein 5 n=1 Tax=Amphimedon queenslandica TaxID=400682 RepID=A0A1X7VFQ0_AMPQE
MEDERELSRRKTRKDEGVSLARPLELFTNSKGRTYVKFTLDGLDWYSYPLQKKVSTQLEHSMLFKFGGDPTIAVQSVLFAHGFTRVRNESPLFNILWTWTHPNLSVVRNLKWFQRINHFLRSEQITHKDYLCMNVQRMQKSKGFKNFNIIPQTFVLPSEMPYFKETFRKGSVWIVKPCHSSRGRRIYLINNPSQICSVEPVVVSRYIDNPLCINGFKFDLRLYVAVTSYDPIRIYLYSEGLGRFAAEPYSKEEENLTNLYMHLTNYSINKTHPDFIMSQSEEVENHGNKWSLSAILNHLRRKGYNIQELMMSIEDAVIKTIISGEVPIASASRHFQPYKANCFELFGFDILIDESLKPWILEVNLSPSLTCDSPLDFKIKSNLITDLMSLIGIPVQDPNPPPPPQTASQSSIKLVRTVRRMPSVSVEEQQVLSCTVDEYKRRGHFVRIFPSEDSWELYGAFLENRTSFNFSLYTHIYPDNLSKMKWPPHSTTSITTMIARRIKKGAQIHILSPDKTNDVKGLSAVHRVKLYASPLQGKGTNCSCLSPPTSDEEDFNTTNYKEDETIYRSSLSVPSLNRYQVRLILTAYLEKVYDKLLHHTKKDAMLKSSDTFEKNLNVIERFISNVSQNLVSHSSTSLPLRHTLPLIVRCKMLTQILMDLIFSYRAETTVLRDKLSDDAIGNVDGCCCEDVMSDNAIEYFISTASETQLERVLREIAATIDLPLVFKLSDNLKVAHSARRAEAHPLKLGRPKKRSLSAGAPIRDTQQQQFSFRRCQSVLPSATRAGLQELLKPQINYLVSDRTVSSLLKKGTMTERSSYKFMQQGCKRLYRDFQSLPLLVKPDDSAGASSRPMRPQSSIYKQNLLSDPIVKIKHMH